MKAMDYIPLYTYNDYQLWEGDWELIHGYPHAMSPSPNRKHQAINTHLAHYFLKEFESPHSSCKECNVHQDLDWKIDEGTVVRPNIMIVCGEFSDDFLNFPPTLVVEILSPGTSMKDRNIKFNLYEGQKVKYYILVNPDNRVCEFFQYEGTSYVQQNEIKNFNLHEQCSMSLDISSLVAGLKL
jgi:Uma2 family endonuclease